MILFSRITCYVVIFQLFVLSSLPAAIRLGFTGQYAKYLNHYEAGFDQKVIPENHDGDLSNEIPFNWEEEIEDKNNLSDFFNSTLLYADYTFSWKSNIHDSDQKFDLYAGVALFILFHCWKTDYLKA